MAKIKYLLKTLLFLCVILLLSASLAYSFRFQILTGLARFLIVNDPLHPADIIVVLSGEVNTRPFHANTLFEQGLAPQVVMVRGEDTPAVEIGLLPNMTDVAVDVMKGLGLPDKNITVLHIEGGGTSTYDEARRLHGYVEEHNIKRIIVVTNAFHTRRAKWIFEKKLSDLPVTLEMAAVSQWEFDEKTWWTKEKGLVTLVNEYIKLLYYWTVY